MKKIILCLMFAGILLAFNPYQLKASTAAPSSTLVVPKTTESAETKVLVLRLNEINAMDKSKLKSSEKKSLRNEVRSIKHQLKESGDYVYLSAGAIIIIILLLIILL